MIYGERIRLRAIERRDLPFFVQWLNDPEVYRTLYVRFPLSLEEEEKWFAEVMQTHPAERPLAIEVREESDRKLIGNCRLFKIDWINASAELGIFIGDKSYWNQGYGSEAVSLLCRHAFETRTCIVCTCTFTNSIGVPFGLTRSVVSSWRDACARRAIMKENTTMC